jgi:PST family polysaccharide transporter
MLTNSITVFAVFLIARRWLKRELPPPPPEVTKMGRRWMAASIPMGLTDGMRVLQSEVTILILGIILAPIDAGLFRIANVSSFTAATPVAVLTYVGFPVIARLYAQKDGRQLQRVLTRLAQAQFAGVLILCVPLIAFPGLLLKLVFGAEYVAAANALRILACAQIVTAALGLNYSLLNMTHYERRVTRAAAFGLAFNVVAVAIFSYFWRLTGAAVAVAITQVGWNVLIWLDARRLLGLETSIFPPRKLRNQPEWIAPTGNA